MDHDFRELNVYKLMYQLAIEVFFESMNFPPEERFALTDQIRRSSRGGCANFAEGYRKKRYPAHFVSKMTDSDAEVAETTVHLDFARDCGYITIERHAELREGYKEVGKILGGIIRNPEPFCGG